MLEWVTIQKLAQESGYSVAALRSKIQRGEFIEGIHWRKSRDGRIQFNVGEYNGWVKGERPELKSAGTASV